MTHIKQSSLSDLPYFAYGSNMNQEQMRQRCPDHKLMGIAKLPNYKLIFPRTSKRWDNLGVASIEHCIGEETWGALYIMTQADWNFLDGKELLGISYIKKTVKVITFDYHNIYALTYIARREKPNQPSKRYLAQIISGAEQLRLPSDYINKLRAIETGN